MTTEIDPEKKALIDGYNARTTGRKAIYDALDKEAYEVGLYMTSSKILLYEYTIKRQEQAAISHPDTRLSERLVQRFTQELIEQQERLEEIEKKIDALKEENQMDGEELTRIIYPTDDDAEAARN